MMGQPKAQASLTSSLLARKGQARPAMRPQGFAGFGNFAEALDDLGWNDMGTGEPAAPVTRVQLRPADANDRETALRPAASQPVAPEPPAVVEEALAPPQPVTPETVAASAPAAEAEVATPVAEPAPSADRAGAGMTSEALVRMGRRIRARQGRGKSAFTLRLDSDRHLRLRLATAICDRSAQHLVTEALDAFLATLPEVEDLARALPAADGKTQRD
ncbi:MAG: hypothetical protein ACTHMG_16220 [Sphingomonas sp.]